MSILPIMAISLLGLPTSASVPAMAAASHTTPWSLANATARTTTLAACQADPGDLANTPDCINAAAAQKDFIVSQL